MNELKRKLQKINGKGYTAYKEIRGSYTFPQFKLFIDYVQGDPFASPSKIRIRVLQLDAKFPLKHLSPKIRKIALEDFITRKIEEYIKNYSRGKRGTGKSGLILIQRCGQEILVRTSVVATNKWVEARLSVGLPAAGRRVLAREAEEMFFKEIPKTAEALYFLNYDSYQLEKHINVAEDQEYLRKMLPSKQLVAFIGEGSVLPRKSGASDLPMEKKEATPFVSPPSLKVEFELPHQGKIAGMGILKGITLIVGGGYHGKTTLLKAIERGIYNHIPEDGRELVVTVEDAVKIRAEDGRRIEKVNISPFIQNLPGKKKTESFSTDNASGSTSQAANIIEALELGAKLLLIDEDTSATNFMIRDERMQALVAKEKEPITPFIDKAKQLYTQLGVSSIVVLGGSGDYFDVADTVIMMDEYLPKDVTQKAQEIAKTWPAKRRGEGGASFGEINHRVPLKESFHPKVGKKIKIKGKGLNIIQFGRHNIDLSFVEQLVDEYQTKTIGALLFYALTKYIDNQSILKEVVEKTLKDIEKYGLDILSAFEGHPGEYAQVRKYELGAAINRLRSLKVKTS